MRDYEALCSELLAGHSVRLKAGGWSMLPLIWDERDEIELAPLQEDSLSVGRIVLAKVSASLYVVHRITQISGTQVTLRGDGNPYQEECVHPGNIYGELVTIIRGGSNLRRGSFVWKCAEYLWPRNPFQRRCLLYAYRKLILRKSREEMRQASTGGHK